MATLDAAAFRTEGYWIELWLASTSFGSHQQGSTWPGAFFGALPATGATLRVTWKSN